MTIATSSAVAFEGAEQDDAEVIRQVLQGNTAMFELLMRRYNERVYRAARAIVRDEQEAEDVMQQAYVNAFTHLRQFNGSAQFSTWLTRIAINESLARVRRQGRYEAFDDELSNVEPLMSHTSFREPRAAGIHRRAARAVGMGDRHAAGRHARGIRAPGSRRPQHVGSGGVPRSHRGCRQDPPVARSGGVEARPAGANGRDRTGSLPVLPSSVRPCRCAGPRPDCSPAAITHAAVRCRRSPLSPFNPSPL